MSLVAFIAHAAKSAHVTPISSFSLYPPGILRSRNGVVGSRETTTPTTPRATHGHGTGWTFEAGADKQGSFLIKDIARGLRDSGVKFKTVMFDSCMMSSIESVCEMQDVAKYVVACEDFCPYNGFTSKNFIPIFDHGKRAKKSLQELCDDFIAYNSHPFPDPFEPTKTHDADVCDVSIWRVAKVRELYDFLKEQAPLIGDKIEYIKDAEVEPDWPVVYDIVTLLSPVVTDKERMYRLLQEASVYRTASADSPKTLHGLSIVRWPPGVEPDHSRWYHTPSYPVSTRFLSPFAQVASQAH